MIFESVVTMTIFDVLVIAMALLMFKYASPDGFFQRWSRGRVIIALGVLTLSLFYAADLLVMHVGPVLVGEMRAMQIMSTMHLEVLWLVTLLSVTLIVIGMQSTNRARARDEQRLSLMTEALPLAVAYIDVEERYRFANSRYAKLHGKTVRDIVGAKVEDILRPNVLEAFREHKRSALRAENPAYEHHTRLELGGEIRDLHIDLVPDVSRKAGVSGLFLLVRDVTATAQLEREVVRAAEAERLSVARDLHDGLGQSLTGISLALVALARKLEQEDSKEVLFVMNLVGMTQNTIEQTRQFTQLLAPTMHGGLFGALRALALEVSALYDVDCYTVCPRDELPISPSVALHLYRIAQESVSNATRHGRAGTIRIDCQTNEHTLVLEINDDGRGIPASQERRDGIGLNSMHYRARMIGGSLRVAPGRDGGTEVACHVPLVSLGPADAVLRSVEPVDTAEVDARAFRTAFEATNAGAAGAAQRSQTVR